MGTRRAVLDPADVEDRGTEFDLVAQLGDPQSVSEGQERCPWRFALAASIRVSTSPGVRCSRVRSSAFGRLVGATVRKTSVGAISWR